MVVVPRDLRVERVRMRGRATRPETLRVYSDGSRWAVPKWAVWKRWVVGVRWGERLWGWGGGLRWKADWEMGRGAGLLASESESGSSLCDFECVGCGDVGVRDCG